jgi:uncharacterized RDD family membrane protein YckC
MEHAGFGSRFFAWLIDGILMGILAGVCAGCAFGAAALAASGDDSFFGVLAALLAFFLFVVVAFFQFVYFGYLWSRDGQSLGMKMLSMRVVRRNSSELCSFWRAGLRGSAGYWISGLVFSLGYLWALIDANKETWHDKIFDTWVVKA